MKSLTVEFIIDEENFISCNCSHCQASNPLLDVVGVPESRELRCLLKVLHALDLSEEIIDTIITRTIDDNYTPVIKNYKNFSIHVSLNGFNKPN